MTGPPYNPLLFKYIQQGLAAARPADPEATDNVNPDGLTIYYSQDTTELAIWDSDADAWIVVPYTALQMTYDNSTSMLAATNVQDALDEIVARLVAHGI